MSFLRWFDIAVLVAALPVFIALDAPLVPGGLPFWTLGLATSAFGYILGRATGWIHEE